jgi:mannose-6-phosphate isomerase
MVTTPLSFVPFLRPMVWGGRRLGTVLGKPLPDGRAYGESWELSDHKSHHSVVAGGPHSGRSLHELMRRSRGDLLGAAAERYPTFPWLIKFLDADDWLSVQVHPDEAAVKKLWPGEGSKTEAWFVLDAAPGSRIYAGLLPGTDAGRLREALAAGAVQECLHSFEPNPGDCVFLPAGTVHAVGGGVLIAEVQQTSDATFRLFDWNRRDAQGQARALHVEESLASVHWDQGPVNPVRVGNRVGRAELVRCRYFALDHVRERKPFRVGGGALQALVVLHGRGRLGAEELGVGQTWLLPAATAAATVTPEGEIAMLVCTLPA